ncbi:hypothetical protein ACFLYX_04435, partial [Chloroflexota bacterium]
VVKKMNKSAIYNGEIEMIMDSTVELKLVSQFYNYLQKVPELRVLYTRGSWDQGTTIAVVLEKPMPLIKVLTEVPGMAITPQPYDKSGSSAGISGSMLGGGEKMTGRLKLLIKEL